MSYLIPELSQIVDRILVLAPTQRSLGKTFEILSEELTQKLGVGQNLDMQLAAPAKGALRSWASFTLGKRGKLDVRISLLGCSLENPPTPNLFEMADAFFIWLPNEPAADRLFSLPIPADVRSRPCVIAGLHDAQELKTLALAEWSRRTFQKVFFVPAPDAFLAEGLEWLLSF